MALILNIDTATDACSVALANDGKIVFEKTELEGRKHSEMLGVFVDEAISFAEKNNLKPDAVAVSAGPGSYTGLRIGVSLAKGLCFGYGIPLIAIETLEVLAYTALLSHKEPGALYCPMIDARRMEVYTSLYTTGLQQLHKTSAEIIENDFLSDKLNSNKIVFFGNGAAKCREVIKHTNAVFADNIVPLATNMAPLSEKAFGQSNFVDVAYYEPHYLKEFMVTTSKKDVLGMTNHRKK